MNLHVVNFDTVPVLVAVSGAVAVAALYKIWRC